MSYQEVTKENHFSSLTFFPVFEPTSHRHSKFDMEKIKNSHKSVMIICGHCGKPKISFKTAVVAVVNTVEIEL